MDIEILLFLQQLREGGMAILISFFEKMTFLGEINTALVIMAIVYWCVDKAFGTYLLMGWSGNRLINGFLKVTACVYRPWIRDPRVVPASSALKTATGYSFPSGHSTNAATIFGGSALRKELSGLARFIFALTAVLVGLSRNFLGVHTPQDVLIGLFAGTLIMGCILKLMAWITAHPEKDLVVLWGGLALCALLALYAGFKPYPADFDADGNLLVDGAVMARDTFKGIGWCAAFLVGWILERRFVKLSTDQVPLQVRITRLAAGMLGYYLVSLVLVAVMKKSIPDPLGTALSAMVQMFYVAFAAPWLFCRIEAKKPVEA